MPGPLADEFSDDGMYRCGSYDASGQRAQTKRDAGAAREVKFPASEALRLPFSVAAENVEHALLTLETATF